MRNDCNQIRYSVSDRNCRTAVGFNACLLCKCAGNDSATRPTQGRDPAELILSAPPADPEATLSTRALYQHIIDLSRGDLPGVVSGQNCYHGDQISAEHQIDGYRRMVEALHAQSGKWVGMIGLDYEHDQIFSADQLSKANQYLVDYWKQGAGLR